MHTLDPAERRNPCRHAAVERRVAVAALTELSFVLQRIILITGIWRDPGL